MKTAFYALFWFLAFASQPLIAEEVKPTYKSDDSQVGRYYTGYVKKELTLEQFQASSAFAVQAPAEGWTFDVDVSQIGQHNAGGYIPPKNPSPMLALGARGEKYRSGGLDSTGMPRAPIYDQGSCGSCVCAAYTAGLQDLLLQRGIETPMLSIGALMWCSHGSQCSGADGETIAADVARLGGLPTNEAIPYRPQNGRCPKTDGMEKFGSVDGWQTIDGSPRSVAAALANRQPVLCGVAADRTFSAYRSGIYNPQNFSMGTNHYVKATNLDCETAVDKDGYCQFDENGNLPNGVGTFTIDNSWSDSYGDNGRIVMKITNKSGRRTNNICGGRGNAQVLTTKIPIPPTEPVVFTVDTVEATFDLVLPPTNRVWTQETLTEAIEAAMDEVGE